MKKTLFVSLSILLLIIGVWAYLFVFGAPQNTNGIFANFGGGNENEFVVTEDNTVLTDEQGPIIASNVLRQITTKPVVGMVFMSDSTVRYVEQGTGYIYDISLEDGTETQVSNTTFTKVGSAIFSSDGTRVVLTYEEGGSRRNVGGTIENGALTTTTLLSTARDFSFEDTNNEITYIADTANGTEAYRYNVDTKTSLLIFTAPFGSARAIFGEKDYLYTKPAASLLGYLYETTSGKLVSRSTGRFGLMTTAFDGGVVITETDNTKILRSTALVNASILDVPLALFPEKCTAANHAGSDLVCGAMFELPTSHKYPDDWYKGVVSMNDYLWNINIETGEATLIVDPFTATGRTIDVGDIVAANDGSAFLLTHKTNNTLWLLTPDL